MRRSYILFFCVCILSCEYEDSNPNQFTGTASALKNGQEWKCGIRMGQNSQYKNSLYLDGMVLNSGGNAIEDFGIGKIGKNLRRQAIHIYSYGIAIDNDSTELSYATIIDGDAVGDIYDVDTTQTCNFIQLTKIDLKRKEVEGVFNVTLILSRNANGGPPAPVQLKFTRGTFKSQIDPKWFK